MQGTGSEYSARATWADSGGSKEARDREAWTLDRRGVPAVGPRAGQELRDESMDRVAMLNEVLSQNPNDAFARYGLALEYSNQGEVDRALDEFGKLLSAHPDYTAGYFMAAQTLAKANRTDEAKKMLSDGIVSA